MSLDIRKLYLLKKINPIPNTNPNPVNTKKPIEELLTDYKKHNDDIINQIQIQISSINNNDNIINELKNKIKLLNNTDNVINELQNKMNLLNNKDDIINDLKIKINSVDNISILPIGTIILFSGIIIPDDWLVCDGSVLSTVDYSLLFNVINTIYGGNGLTNFNIPDFRGNVPVGVNSKYNLGNSGGDEVHTLTVDELPAHNHTGTTQIAGNHNHSGFTNITGDHIHNTNTNGNVYNEYGLIHKSYGGLNTESTTNLQENIGYPDLITPPLQLDIYTSGSHKHNITDDGNHTHNFTTDNTGSNLAYKLMQPYLVIYYLIKYK